MPRRPLRPAAAVRELDTSDLFNDHDVAGVEFTNRGSAGLTFEDITDLGELGRLAFQQVDVTEQMAKIGLCPLFA